MSTYNELMQTLFRRYRQEVGVRGPTSLGDVGMWAIDKGLWKPQPRDVLRQFTADMGKALREEFYTDPQGRRVRTNHAVRLPKAKETGEQQSFETVWDDIRTTTRKHMVTSAQQRRQGIVADCLHLKTDVDSFNDNRSPSEPIQISFDMRADVAELEAVAV